MTKNICGRAERVQGEAAKLRQLLLMSGVRKSHIDRGVYRVDFHNNHSKPKLVSGTKGNGKLEDEETYAAAIERLEKEQHRFASSGGKARRRFTNLVSSCTGFRLPWLFNDFDPGTSSDDDVLAGIVKKIAAIKKSVKGFRRGTIDYKVAFLYKLVSWMERAVKRQSYVPYESSNLELMNGAPGDCTELTRFAYAVLKLAGFKPEFIIVIKHAPNARPRHHRVAVGVPLDPKNPNDLMQVDLYRKGFLGSTHRGWVRVPKQTMLTIEEVTKGWHLSWIRNILLRYDRGYRRFPFGALPGLLVRGMLYAVSAIMMSHYERAIQFDRHFPDTYYNMASVLHLLGRNDAAVERLNNRALALRPSMHEALLLKQRIAAARANAASLRIAHTER